MKKPSYTRSLIALLLFFSPYQLFSQTFIGVNAVPGDNGTQTGPTVSVAPPGGTQAGDLIIIFAQYRNTGVTLSISAAAGQTWKTAANPAGATNQTFAVFYCRYNGTWSGNPSVTVGSGTSGMSAIIYVFRPTNSARGWAVNAGPSNSAAIGTAININQLTTTANNTVTMAFWASPASVTWGAASAGWTKPPTAQYRNLAAGSNQTQTSAYRILAAPAATTGVSQTQSASQTTQTSIISWNETPGNDDCASAYTLVSSTTCVAGSSSFTGQSLNGATVEGAGLATSCGGSTTSQDVWYKFVAQNQFPTITLSNLGASWGTSMRMQLLSGSCGSFTEIACANNAPITPAAPLTIGNTYYIRILKNNTTVPVSGWGFDICITASASMAVSSAMNEVFQVNELTTGPGGGSGTRFYDPWEVAYGPDDSLWVTEAKNYKVYKISPNGGTRRVVLDISPGSTFLPVADRVFNLSFPTGFPTLLGGGYTTATNKAPQGGLAGLALHPKFPDSPYVFVSYIWKFVKHLNTANQTVVATPTTTTTTTTTGTPANGGIYYQNALVRFTFNSTTGQLGSPMSVCDTLPGSQDHNSQRMIIAPIGNTYYLFYANGDMGAGQFGNSARPNNAQDLNSYEGKILRFNVDPQNGQGAYDKWIPDTNPFNATLGKESAVWAFGFRNNQGFAYAKINGTDHLYGQQHGPFSDDEINEIQGGGNYGHPYVIGYKKDGNFNNAAAGNPETPWTGAYSGIKGGLPVIGNEAHNADSMNQFHTYHDPIFSYYPAPAGSSALADVSNPTPVPDEIESVQYIYYWFNKPGNVVNGNQYWRSEAPSGMDAYTKALIPGWKNSLISCIMKGVPDPANQGNWRVETSVAGKIGSPVGPAGSGTAASGKLMRLKLSSTGDGLKVSPLNADSTLKPSSAYTDDTVAYFTSRNRFRDVAISKDGLSLFAVIDSSSTTSGPTSTNPAVSLCKGCLLKYTFLGYQDAGGKSTISTKIDVTDGTVNTVDSATTVTINSTNNRFWVPITGPDGNILAEIYANGNNLGKIRTAYYKHSGPIRVKGGVHYLDRNITITPEFQPNPTDSVLVRLYFSKTELDALKADPAAGVTGINSLVILKNDDTCRSSIAASTIQANTLYKEAHGTDGYMLQGKIGSFSSFYFASSNITLPLNLLTFKGTLQNSTTILEWRTANEINTSHFVVERSTDSRNFQQIGTVAANGSTGMTNKYSYVDYDVTRQSSSVIYYRLKLMDNDGSYTYSDIVTITLPFITNRVSLFPNPAAHEVNVTITTGVDGKVKWQLVDNSGRIVSHSSMAAKKGNNNLIINLNRLSTGTYFLIVSGADIDQKVKLEKL